MSRGSRATEFGFVGLVYGLIVAGLAVMLAGAGHGWCSPIASWKGIVLVPAFGAASALHPRSRRWLLLVIAAGAGLVDGEFLYAAQREDRQYFDRIWAMAPGWIVAWAILWCAWQLAVVGILIHDLGYSPRPDRESSKKSGLPPHQSH